MIKLSEISCEAPPGLKKKDLAEETDRLVERLGELQHLMYAQGKHAALVVLQGMDASGKDGAVRRVFSQCTIAGLDLASFKKPTEEEFAHDFLWRVHRWVTQKGMMTIFNRRHYEDILIKRVLGLSQIDIIHNRMEAIQCVEEMLAYVALIKAG